MMKLKIFQDALPISNNKFEKEIQITLWDIGFNPNELLFTSEDCENYEKWEECNKKRRMHILVDVRTMLWGSEYTATIAVHYADSVEGIRCNPLTHLWAP